MQATTNPGGIGTESLATDLQGELQRIRYVLNRILGKGTQWYDTPDIDLHTVTAGMPPGMVADFASTSAPSGWLACDGSAVSRSSYAALFAAIGTTWGSGDGSTTFNLPASARKVRVGSGGSSSGTLGNTVGSTGGAETHTLTQAELPTALGTATSVVTDPGHNHNIRVFQDNATQGGQVRGTASGVQQGNETSDSTTTGITVATTITNGSGGNAHSVMQPSAVYLTCIKT